MEKELIETLESIKKNHYDFADVNKAELADRCLMHIGDPDGTIRDGLVYGVLAHLLHDKYFNEAELTRYLEQLISADFLSYDLENKQPNSVLRRSFSILQLVILVYVHRRDGILEKASIERVYHAFLAYFVQETILTGYDAQVGWVHAIAHSADLFAQLMQISWFDENRLMEMFSAIVDKFKQKNHFYTFDEDERMTIAIKNGIARQIMSRDFIESWLDRFLIADPPTEYLERLYYQNNIKCFLRSLYFTFLEDANYHWITDRIREILIKNKTRKPQL